MSEPSVVLVGIDGSEESVAALRWALAHSPTGHVVRAVHVWQFPTTYGYIPGPGFESFDEQAAAVLNDAVARGRRGVRRRVEQVVVANQLPQATLCELSRSAALLVVGRRGHHGLGRRLTGSVSRYCVGNAACPVVVVPTPAPPASSATMSAAVAGSRTRPTD